MFTKRLIPICLLAVSTLSTVAVTADQMVPFKGHWSGVTVSAYPNPFPVISIVSEGGGRATHLGRYTMVSPHTSNVFTGETLGDQIFTAANGDTLTAYCEGFGLPDEITGIVEATLDCTITGGTGRFAGATGSYDFSFVASPRTDGGLGYATEAEIRGSISN